ncbi:MAG: tRNA (guanosine(37)-N1)-methyltransferase TrmD [Clostridia bacterium]|nr:tRNA (guanosine(37)-N1)-methyltransferase TrmD [Clostridia bacterium]
MRFDILTLFPEMVENILGESIIGRARDKGLIEIAAHNIRDYSEDKHRRVDDTPCGGGKGMLMAVPPIDRCHGAVSALAPTLKTRTVYMSPQGRVLTQGIAKELSEYDRLIILCGHYEGVDRRAVEMLCDDEISIGDFVLTGGELPACVLVDCVSRMVPGVLSEDECFEKESFMNGLLEYPQYTRPIEYKGRRVPEVLLSGDHKKIEEWRKKEAYELTKRKRPDLI